MIFAERKKYFNSSPKPGDPVRPTLTGCDPRGLLVGFGATQPDAVGRGWICPGRRRPHHVGLPQPQAARPVPHLTYLTLYLPSLHSITTLRVCNSPGGIIATFLKIFFPIQDY